MTYLRKHLLRRTSAPFLLLSLAFFGACFVEGTPKPNIVVFLVDDLGYMDIGANNPECFYETPHIDALAESGMRFTDGYAANPVCSPTRYSLMTGKYPSRVDATNFFSGKRSGTFNPAPLVDNMPLEEITIAQVLKGRDTPPSLPANGTWERVRSIIPRTGASMSIWGAIPEAGPIRETSIFPHSRILNCIPTARRETICRIAWPGIPPNS